MKIGVMSDSHDNLPAIRRALARFEAEGAEAVIHAGDFVAPFSIKELLKFKGALYGCFGNNDGEKAGIRALWPAVAEPPCELQLGGRRILLTHDEAALRENAGPAPARRGGDLRPFAQDRPRRAPRRRPGAPEPGRMRRLADRHEHGGDPRYRDARCAHPGNLTADLKADDRPPCIVRKDREAATHPALRSRRPGAPHRLRRAHADPAFRSARRNGGRQRRRSRRRPGEAALRDLRHVRGRHERPALSPAARPGAGAAALVRDGFRSTSSPKRSGPARSTTSIS